MCYSVKTSLVAYTLGILSFIFALYTKQYILGFLILFYCQIQLGEAIIWYGIDTDNIGLNKFGTSFLKYMLATHIIGIGIGVYIATKDIRVLIFGIICFIAVIIYYKLTDNKDLDTTYPANRTLEKVCQSSSNRLKWPFSQGWYFFYYIIGIILILLYIPELYSKIFIIGFFSIIYLLSFIYFKQTTSSIWCMLSAIAAPILVIGNYFILKK